MKTREFSDIALDEPLENGIVLKTIDGARATNVPHVVTHHSPDGFSWGYAGFESSQGFYARALPILRSISLVPADHESRKQMPVAHSFCRIAP